MNRPQVMRRPAAVLLVGCALLALQVEVRPQQGPPTFRGRTDLVTVDVSVTEGNGRPVTGLTEKDFSVFEDGVPQPVTVFRAVSVVAQPWAAPWAGGVRQDVVTNDAPTGRLIAIVLDDATLPAVPEVMNFARTAARALIDDLGPDDRCALVFTRDSRRAQPFTSDRVRLGAAVDRMDAGFIGMGADVTESHYAVGALRTLEDVVQALGASDHYPRALVYVGVGIDINWDLVSAPGRLGKAGSAALQQAHQTYAARLRAILQHAGRLNIAIHTVNPGDRGSQDFLLTLARNTGGVYAAAVGDVRVAVARIADATRSVYLLGYVPAVWKPGLRRIDVKVHRSGVVVRTRDYDARLADAGEARPDARKPPAELAAISGVLPKPGIPLRVMAISSPIGASREAAVAIVLGVSHPSGGQRALESVSVTASAYDMEGRFKAGIRGRAQVRMAANADVTAEYEVYSRLQLPAGRYQLRLSVDHRARGETGSVYTDVDVPDFSKPGLHVAAVLLDAGPARLKAAPEGLLADVFPISPTTQREFHVGARFLAFTRLVQTGDRLRAVAVTVELIDERGRVVRTATETLEAGRFSQGRVADYSTGVTTEGLVPGWYLLAFKAALPDSTPQVETLTLRVRG